VIVFTACNDIDTCDAAFEADATACVLKQPLYVDGVAAIKLAVSGVQFVSPGLRYRVSLLAIPLRPSGVCELKFARAFECPATFEEYLATSGTECMFNADRRSN
jgi:hypothetical protein